jgi:hypothetical protein
MKEEEEDGSEIFLSISKNRQFEKKVIEVV